MKTTCTRDSGVPRFVLSLRSPARTGRPSLARAASRTTRRGFRMTQASLAGLWTLHDGNGAVGGACPIPGDIHPALYALGRIPDPMVGTNEADVQWVAEAEWEIRLS